MGNSGGSRLSYRVADETSVLTSGDFVQVLGLSCWIYRVLNGRFFDIKRTIAGGILGFYVMHRLELSYKAKWDERLKKYEEEKMRKANEQDGVIQAVDSSVYFADDRSSSPQSN